jgi:hypothetical protein
MEIEDKYLNASNCKDGDIIILLDAGVKETIENRFKPGTKKDVYNFNVEVNGKRYIYSPNSTTLKNLIKSFGKTTEKWVGKKLQVQLALTTSGNKAIMPAILDVKI